MYARFSEARAEEPLAGFAMDEVALELHITRNAAGSRLYLGCNLVERLPATLAAMERGEIGLYKARVLEELTHPLSPEAARAVEEKVLARAPEQTAPQLRQATRWAVLHVDPDGVRARHVQRKAGRKVVECPTEDGMAELTATVTAPEATAIYQRLDAIARMCRDDRTMDQRRADVFVDLLLGKACYDAPATAATINVAVAATTLAGMDDRPGGLAGYGSITVAMARQLAADGTWRRLLTGPANGALLECVVPPTGHPPRWPTLCGRGTRRAGSLGVANRRNNASSTISRHSRKAPPTRPTSASSAAGTTASSTPQAGPSPEKQTAPTTGGAPPAGNTKQTYKTKPEPYDENDDDLGG